MVFSSIAFLFFFLPAFLLLFYLLKYLPKLQFLFLLLSSLLFYFWGENFLVWILLTSTGIDYFASLIIAKGFNRNKILALDPGSHRSKKQKLGLTISIVSNLTFLGYFKYYNFFIENFNSFCHSLGLDGLVSNQFTAIALPLGISFYTFQSMSYTIDVYRGKVTGTRDFIKFASFVSMFPQLVAGPIVRYSDIEGQMNNHHLTSDNFVIGIKRFIIGLAKKVIIANSLALVADSIFALPANELSSGLAWLGILSYSLQLYFDFSGYSCMAIGLGRMMGFTFPENFNYPYISRSIGEFWQRWHITLSTWFRDYLYIPLGGSRKGNLITYRNLLIVFITCGLWHGSSWNYIIWGLSHGFFMVLEKLPIAKYFKKLPKIIHHIYMLLAFNLTLVIFRVETIPGAIHYLSVLFGNSELKTSISSFKELMPLNIQLVFIAGIIFSTPVFVLIKNKIENLSSHYRNVFEIMYLAILIILFVFSAMSLASGTYNPFIYFRF